MNEYLKTITIIKSDLDDTLKKLLDKEEEQLLWIFQEKLLTILVLTLCGQRTQFFDQMNQENLTLNGNVYVYEISNEKTNSRGTTKFAFPEELTVYMLYWIKALDKLKIKQNFWINRLGNSMTENQMNRIIKNNVTKIIPNNLRKKVANYFFFMIAYWKIKVKKKLKTNCSFTQKC